jgi:2-oxoisovalerate ferredoxin oxidoreductase beta subunit
VRTSLHERPKSFFDSFERKEGDRTVTHYCPGCGHGNVHKLISEAIDDFGIADRTIFVDPVGCSVFAYYYLDVGHVQAAHGRAPAVATAVKRAHPGSIVICYQGDGDLAAIGGNEILQAASRGEDITVIFINNALYGMTGGQMAPTTLLGQVTTTSPLGRSASQEGYPMRVSELLASLEAPAYIARVALGDIKSVLQARKAIRHAIKNQMEGRGFSLVEILSPCPTGWKMTPPDAAKWVLETMTKTFPLATVRDRAPSVGTPRDRAPSAGTPRDGAAGADAPREMTGRRTEVALQEIPRLLGLVSPVAPAGQTAAPGAVEARFRAPRSVSRGVSRGVSRIKAAGFGGQGALFLGALIAEAGMRAGRAVSWLPSYGPEMRGGTAHCHVIVSDGAVDSPLVTKSTVLFAFNRPSLEKFVPEVVEGGMVVYDASLITDPPPMPGLEAIAVPASRLADALGAARVANMVALGAWLGRTRALPVEAVEAALRDKMKPEVVALNMRAIEAGRRFILQGGVAQGAASGATGPDGATSTGGAP